MGIPGRAISSRLSGHIVGYGNVEMSGAWGQDVVVVEAAATHRIRSVIVGSRLITLSVSGPVKVVGTAVADRFLGSLGTSN